MHVLMTGAAGNIGRSVLRLFAADPDVQVRAYDLNHGEDLEGVEWVQGDIRDVDAVVSGLDGIDAVVHLAAIPAYFPDQNLDIGSHNIVGTQTMLEAVARGGVRRFVQASSICATGFIFSSKPLPAPYLPIDEKYQTQPDDMYGISKLACEHLAAGYESRYGIETTSFRIASVWDKESEVSRHEVSSMLRPEFDSDMTYVDLRWAYIDVRDVAQAFLLAVKHPTGLGVCNLGASDTPGGDCTIWIEDRFPDAPHECIRDAGDALFSIEKLRTLTSYAPEHSWQEYSAFLEAWPWYLERRQALAHA